MFTDEELREKGAIRHEGKIYKFLMKTNTKNEAEFQAEEYTKEGYEILIKKNTEGCGHALYADWKSMNEGIKEFEESESQFEERE